MMHFGRFQELFFCVSQEELMKLFEPLKGSFYRAGILGIKEEMIFSMRPDINAHFFYTNDEEKIFFKDIGARVKIFARAPLLHIGPLFGRIADGKLFLDAKSSDSFFCGIAVRLPLLFQNSTEKAQEWTLAQDDCEVKDFVLLRKNVRSVTNVFSPSCLRYSAAGLCFLRTIPTFCSFHDSVKKN